MAVLDSPELTQAREKSQAASQRATEASASAIQMPDILRQAVSERFKESPLHGQFEGAAQDFLTAVPQAREELAGMVTGGGPILSPTQQQSVLAGRRAASMVPLISLNDLIQSQLGGIENLIGAGTRAYQAQTQRMLGEADLARQSYQDILNELVTEEQLRQSAEGLEDSDSDAGALDFGFDLGGEVDGFIPDTGGGGFTPSAIPASPEVSGVGFIDRALEELTRPSVARGGGAAAPIGEQALGGWTLTDNPFVRAARPITDFVSGGVGRFRNWFNRLGSET